MVTAAFARPVERRTLADRAHRGDIEGAWGTVRVTDPPRGSGSGRLLTLLAVLGPGVLVLVADNDAGGITLYAQVGCAHGTGLLWLLAVLAPVLFVNQEMVARLGAVTGTGHARLIFLRFGRFWGRFAVVDLLVLNALTIVTEFIGVAAGAGYFGIPRWVSVPVAAVALILVTSRGSFAGWERAMSLAVLTSLVVLPLVGIALVRARAGTVAGGGPGLAPGPRGAATLAALAPGGGATVLFAIALVGATVAPWQLFLQQSNVVDKRITARWVAYARADTLVGTVLFLLGAAGVVVVAAIGLRHGAGAGDLDAGRAASALRASLGPWAGGLFAVLLLDGSLLGAAAVTLSCSYAIGDATGLRHSLHRPWRRARTFHGSFAALVLLAAAVVLLPGTPVGAVTLLVNVLAGVLLPGATVFLVLLCNDRAVLGPWTNPPWLNAVAGAVIAGLLVLCAALVGITLFPRPSVSVRVPFPALVPGIGVPVLVLAWAAVLAARPRRRSAEDRGTWSMPLPESLPAPRETRGRTIALVSLRVYLVLVVVLVLVRAAHVLLG